MVNFNTTKALSTLINPSSILPVATIEAVTTGGRTYQAYKRGGKEEGTERLREESISAVFWLFGVKVLNSLGDFLGKKIGIENLDIDLGADELRAPYLNIPESKRFKTCAFKFGKIIGSAAIATFLMGVVLPRFNHKLTNMARKAQGLEPIPEKNEKKSANNASKKIETEGLKQNQMSAQNFAVLSSGAKPLNIQDFVSSSKEDAKNLTFKGVTEFLATGSHYLENNTACRLMSTDVGMIAGRVANSRNKFEGMEFLFRDTSSIYFYLFAAPHTHALLNKITNNTAIHPDSLNVLKAHLVTSIGEDKISLDDFMKRTKTVPPDIKDALSKVPFDKKGVVTLDKFNEATNSIYKEKAKIMSQMQPKMKGVSLLSKQQAELVLSSGWISEPEFLKKAVNAGTYGAALDNKKYVPRKTIEKIVSSLDKFNDNLVKYAKSKGVDEIDAKFIEKYAKRTLNMNLAFRVSGMAVAGFGLAYLIPKLQYKMTELRTGSKQFPGTATYSNDNNDIKNTPLNANA